MGIGLTMVTVIGENTNIGDKNVQLNLNEI